jgi:2,4-dienoyl-CoA reductase-like NADH-dependent reductase (Old Yellow Enzyme family)
MDTDSTTDPVLLDVENFLQASQMTATAFGQRALNDPTLVHELRRGRECKMATRRRIRDFIRDFADGVVAASEGRSVPDVQREAV